MRKIFISGVPGTGKTTIGNYFKDHYGFEHLNFEEPNGNPAPITGDISSLDTQLNHIQRDLVITWGFGPDIPQHVEIVKFLTNNGAKLVWLDGNRDAAERAFTMRGTVSKEMLDIQMDRINKIDIDTLFHPLRYNTFDENGNFKDLNIIADDILKLTED